MLTNKAKYGLRAMCALAQADGGRLQAHAIASISLDGVYQERAQLAPGSAPVGLASTGDAVWFVEIGSSKIGRCTTAGEVTEYPLWESGAKPHAIVPDLAGGCWFTAWAGNRVGHIAVKSEVTSYEIPTPDAEPHGITVAPDGVVKSSSSPSTGSPAG